MESDCIVRLESSSILITGGTGFIGRSIVTALQQAGAHVTVVSRAPALPASISEAKHIRADLTNLSFAGAVALFDGIDVVIHCAGALSDESSMKDLHERSTGMLAQAARGRVAHWVQLSSVGALGHQASGTVTPNNRGEPLGLYEVTKHRGDYLVTTALSGSPTTLSVLMPTIVFGPGMSSSGLRRLSGAVQGGWFFHVSAFDTPAHYIFVEDVADAVVTAVRERFEGTYVVQDPCTVAELVDELAELAKKPSPRHRVPESFIKALISPRLRSLRIPGRSALTALRSETRYANDEGSLTWRPPVGWREGLKRVQEGGGGESAKGISIVYITTVPMTLEFFRGHLRHERACGSTVHLISSANGGELHNFAAGSNVHAQPVEMARTIAPLTDLLTLLRLCRILRRIRPDVVQTATPKAGLLGGVAARLTGVPVIVVGLFGLPQMTEEGWRLRLLNATTRMSAAAAHIVWCDSHSMASYAESSDLVSGDKLRVVGRGSVGGVDGQGTFDGGRLASEGAGVRVELGIPPSAQVVGYVGRLARDKGMLELGLAWEVLRERYPEAHLVLVGPDEGDMLPSTQHTFASDERIHVVGRQASVARYFAAMDLFVMPSYREGFCTTNIEAAAMGLPVVATRIPGCIDSVADGQTGTLVPVRDAHALSGAIADYLDSPTLSRGHGQAGRRRALSEFDPSVIQEELSQMYRTALPLGHEFRVLPERPPRGHRRSESNV